MRRIMVALLLALAFLAVPATAQIIDPAKGVDARVDYASLDLFGPWDDRNYQLTKEDLDLLAPDEADLRDSIPAFFRIEMRKAWPTLRRSGPAQYPRSALQIFRQMFGGYLIDGKLYNRAKRLNGRYVIDLVDGRAAESFQNGRFLSGEVRVTNPTGAAESAIKISPVDTNKVVAGSNGPGGGQKMHFSTDGGDSWTETLLPLGGTCCDPAVDWSSDGSLAYATTLGACGFSGCSVWVYRSNDGGQTWNGFETDTPGDPRRELTGAGSDKEYLHVDQSASSPFKDNVYVTWHDGNVMKFAVSTDDGNSWTQQSFGGLSSDLGIGSDITTDAAGNVYYIWPAFNSRTIRMRKSTNGGASFGSTVVVGNTQASFIFPLPSIDTREAFVYVAADTDRTGGLFSGTIYAAWTDSTAPTSGTPSANHGRIQVAHSRNGGASWTVTTPHETADAGSVDRWHPWLAVGPDGTVHVVFYDTRRDPTRTGVDLFYSFSTDGGQSWSLPDRVTSVLSPNIGDSFEFGDYNGLDIVTNDLIAIFTDNRNESGGGLDSVDVYAAGIPPGAGGTCGNNTIESGEVCDGSDLGGQSCGDFGCSGGALACNGDCLGFDTSGCTGCNLCNDNLICEALEDCNNCPGDCQSGTTSGAVCGNGVCEAGNGENCTNCAADCNGRQGGKPANRFCCGDGGGQNPAPCTDSRCLTGGFACTTVPANPGSFCCGDLTCDSGESCGNCPIDCAAGIEICDNGVDDDCVNGADCADGSCATDPACTGPACEPVGASCTSNSDCCTNKCRGKSGSKTCR